MPIQLNLERVMAERDISLTDLADRVGITLANLSILKTNKAKAVRFSTLEALCRELGCQPADLLQYVDEKPGGASAPSLTLVCVLVLVSCSTAEPPSSPGHASQNRFGSSPAGGFSVMVAKIPAFVVKLTLSQAKTNWL